MAKEFFKSEEIVLEYPSEGVSRQIFGYNDQMMMVRVNFVSGAIGAPHTHPHVQSCFVAKGRFEVTIDGKVDLLKEGDGFFVESDILHSVVCLEEGTLVDIFTPMRKDFL